MRGQVEVEVETAEVASFLLLHFVDLVFGKDHAAFGMIGMRQGQESLGPQPFLTDILGRHGGQFFPRLHTGWQFGPHTLLHGLPRDMVTPSAGRSLKSYRSSRKHRLPCFDDRFFRLQCAPACGRTPLALRPGA